MVLPPEIIVEPGPINIGRIAKYQPVHPQAVHYPPQPGRIPNARGKRLTHRAACEKTRKEGVARVRTEPRPILAADRKPVGVPYLTNRKKDTKTSQQGNPGPLN